MRDMVDKGYNEEIAITKNLENSDDKDDKHNAELGLDNKVH